MPDRRSTLHLHWRAGFGLRPAELQALERLPHAAQVERLFAGSSGTTPITTAHTTATLAVYEAMKAPEQYRFRQASRDAIERLNAGWCEAMLRTGGALREKMALFWHGHFACRGLWSNSTEQYLGVLRTHALGRFGDLLKAVARSAAMMQFLDEQRNHREAPNENFAREVMELFTLGPGHYTETDIREAARAFTGRAYRLEDAGYRFDPARHDGGMKVFRGERGAFDGDAILDRLLADEQTAHHVAGRVCSWLVHPSPDAGLVRAMGERFHRSGHDIGDLVRAILLSDHFRDAAVHGRRIKTPVELLLGLRKLFAIRFHDARQAIWLQQHLGQQLFQPPGVAGWPEGAAWIDGAALLQRLQLPGALLGASMPQADSGAQDGAGVAGAPLRDDRGDAVQVTADVAGFLQELGGAPDDELLSGSILVVEPSPRHRASGAAMRPQERLLALLSSPEYQLC